MNLYRNNNNNNNNIKSIAHVALFLLITNVGSLNGRVTRTPAQVLAKQTGATIYEERFESTDCSDHKHRLKKRASDEDVDYEVYQGVVGRPGIDFPIFPRIPQTTFSCRTFGNGYFADLETDCQVFHICEEGRKISFLCPNGTIFQQSELTCDWWFKVNCAGSPGLYAESAEILHKARRHRVRPTVPLKDFQIVNGPTALDARLPHESAAKRFNIYDKTDRRIDSNEEPTLESIDFEDISAEKQLTSKSETISKNLENNNNENEFQITAESASFVGSHRRMSYNDDRPETKKSDEQIEKDYQGENYNRNSKKENNRRGKETSTAKKHASTVRNNHRVESSERTRSLNRGNQRFETKSQAEKIQNSHSHEDRTTSHEEVNSLNRRGNGNRNVQNIVTTEGPIKPEFYSPSSSNFTTSRNPSKNSNPGTYSTPRRLELTKTTPFYTPTVPSIIKTKPTDPEARTVNFTSVNLKTPAPCSTNTPVTVGLRFLNTNKSSAIHRFSLTSGEEIKVNDPVHKTLPAKRTELSTSTAEIPTTTNSVLFANSPAQEDSLTRNVKAMLKTVNMIKDTIEQVSAKEEENFQGKVRSGLEIPPSSGPDAIVSFANYFANAENSEKSAMPIAEASSATTLPTPSTDDIKSGLLSDKILKQYSTLFGLEDVNDDDQQAKNKELPNGLEPTTTFDVSQTEQVDQVESTSSINLKGLAQKPETRKIARVFSNALTTYLEDPESFRKKLTEVRPTEPPVAAKDNLISTSVSDPTLFDQGTAATYLPTNSAAYTTTSTQFDPLDITTTTQSNNIAAEINNNFDSSKQFAESTETPTSTVVTTFSPELKFKFDLSEELLPPNQDESEESLQRSQTQSFVKSMNELPNEQSESDSFRSQPSSKYKLENARQKLTTEAPWSQSQSSPTAYLDPLTINDGLMNEIKTTTMSPFAYLPIQQRTTSSRAEPITPTTTTTTTTVKQKRVTFSMPIPLIKTSQNRFLESSTPRAENFDEFGEFLDSPELSQELLPSSSGLQRIANKLFGGLNEVEAQHLQNVMQQAENNRNILKLLLLLIQTCDDHNGKILEKSRKSLLNALIEMDEIQQERKHTSSTKRSRPEKYIASGPTTNRIPVTTYRRSFDITTILNPTTTTAPLLDYFTTTTTSGQSSEETTKFEIHVAEPDDDDLANGKESQPSTPASLPVSPTTLRSERNASERGSDQRALGLLKSLYSLASKFSNRR